MDQSSKYILKIKRILQVYHFGKVVCYFGKEVTGIIESSNVKAATEIFCIV